MALQCFYLSEVTKFKPTELNPTPVTLATVPLIQYLLGMLFSLKLQTRLTQYFKNRMKMMQLAVVVTSVSSIPLAFLDESTQMWVYPFVAIQGIGIAIMLNTATSLISDVIGTDSENSAFVYGCYSFFERCSNGVLIFYFISKYSADE